MKRFVLKALFRGTGMERPSSRDESWRHITEDENESPTHAKSSMPYPRSAHKMVCDEDNMYVFGGYVSTPSADDFETFSTVISDLWRYSFVTGKWTNLTCVNLPKETCMSALILLSSNVLAIFGGTDLPLQTSCTNDLIVGHVLSEPDHNVCVFRIIVTTGDIPPPVFGHCICIHDGFLYTVGGTDGRTYMENMYRLDLTEKKWQIIYRPHDDNGDNNSVNDNDYELPHVRFAHQIAVYDERIYLIGGSQYNIVQDFATIMYFDLETNRWFKIPTFGDERVDLTSSYPTRRTFFTGVQDSQNPSFTYITGGMTAEGVALSDCWTLDLSIMKWSRMEMFDLCRAAYMHASGITETGKIIHFGGIEAIQNTYRPHRSNCMSTAWIYIPSLKAMAWDALCYFFRNNYIPEKHIDEYIPHFKHRMFLSDRKKKKD